MKKLQPLSPLLALYFPEHFHLHVWNLSVLRGNGSLKHRWNICISKFMAALFTYNSHSLMDTWIMNTCHIHTVEYYSVPNRKKISLRAVMDKPWGHYANWSKLLTDRHLLWLHFNVNTLRTTLRSGKEGKFCFMCFSLKPQLKSKEKHTVTLDNSNRTTKELICWRHARAE